VVFVTGKLPIMIISHANYSPLLMISIRYQKFHGYSVVSKTSGLMAISLMAVKPQ
jgi:hypothetical protein